MPQTISYPLSYLPLAKGAVQDRGLSHRECLRRNKLKRPYRAVYFIYRKLALTLMSVANKRLS